MLKLHHHGDLGHDTCRITSVKELLETRSGLLPKSPKKGPQAGSGLGTHQPHPSPLEAAASRGGGSNYLTQGGKWGIKLLATRVINTYFSF